MFDREMVEEVSGTQVLGGLRNELTPAPVCQRVAAIFASVGADLSICEFQVAPESIVILTPRSSCVKAGFLNAGSRDR